MPDQPRKIDLLVFRSDPEFPRSGDRLRDIRGMDQHLAGYASPVQARAAQRPFFHDSNFHPFCSSRGRDRQSGAAADDDEVEGAHRREARTRVYMLFDVIRVGAKISAYACLPIGRSPQDILSDLSEAKWRGMPKLRIRTNKNFAPTPMRLPKPFYLFDQCVIHLFLFCRREGKKLFFDHSGSNSEEVIELDDALFYCPLFLG